eukprot:TRINITY_DN70738_c0_g1_i1.p1 TRINITY_DN70738_c0_g1~~TRINITY_DN70738_c0_g1_i1.p1  ORF type:complete len:743 (+),score=118.96 TRINITY_DN70738_c0_g1_i1:309-2537(+)
MPSCAAVGFGVTAWDLNAAIASAVRAADWPAALSLLQSSRQRRSDAREFQEAGSKVVTTLKLAGVEADASSFNSVVAAVARSQRWALAQALSAMQRSDSCLPDAVSWNVLMNAAKRSTRWDAAVRTLATALSAKAQLGIRSYNTAVSTCNAADSDTGRFWRRAFSLAAEALCRGGLLVDILTFNSLVASCSYQRSWPRGLHALAAAACLLLELDVFSLSSSMSACERARAWAAPLQLLLDVARSHLRPNLVLLGTALNACARGQRWELALRQLAGLMHCKGSGLRPDASSFGAALSAFAGAIQWNNALLLQTGAMDAAADLDGSALCSVLSSCERRGKWGEALLQYRFILAAGLQLQVATCNACISASRQEDRWQQAACFAQTTLHLAMSPTAVTRGATVDACEKAGCWAVALSLLSQPTGAALGTGDLFCGAALAACEGEGLWQRAQALLFAMGSRRDLLSVALVVGACDLARQPGVTALPALCSTLRSDALDLSGEAIMPGAARSSARRARGDASAAAPAAPLMAAAVDKLLAHGALDGLLDASFRRFPVCQRLLLRFRTLRTAKARAEGPSPHCLRTDADEQLYSLGPLHTSFALWDLALGGSCSRPRHSPAAPSPAESCSWVLRPRLDDRREIHGEHLCPPAGQPPPQRPNADFMPAWLAHSGMLAHSGAHGRAVGAGSDRTLPGHWLVPVFVEHDRSGHAERFGLLQLLQQLRRTCSRPSVVAASGTPLSARRKADS